MGDGTTTNRSTPVVVSSISTATQAAAGDLHSLVLLSDGTIRALGYNGLGQLGDGTTTNRTSPVTVSGITKAKFISTFYRSSYSLNNDSTIKAWGENGLYQLGDGTTTNRNSAVTMSTGCVPISLPIKWLNYSASCEKNNLLIRWQTDESNNLVGGNYLIQYSADGLNFYIQKVNAITASNSVKYYSINIPNKVKEGLVKYVRIGFENSAENSQINAVQIEVSCNIGEKSISVFPNPAQAILYLTGNFNLKEIQSVRITTVSGQEIQNLGRPEKTTISVVNLNPGIYLLEIQWGNQKITTKFLKN